MNRLLESSSARLDLPPNRARMLNGPPCWSEGREALPRRESKRRRRPSYEDGRFRDSEIERKQDPSYTKDDLERLVRKAAPTRKKAS